MNLLRKISLASLLVLLVVSCKKETAPSFELTIAASDNKHLNTSVNIKEVWLNYSTKKSNSEWIRLNIAAGIYDLSDLYIDQRDTLLMPQTPIEDLQTLIQLRFIFGDTNNFVITNTQDTLDMAVSGIGLSGYKVGVNSGLEPAKRYKVRLAMYGDTTAILGASPSFDPFIRLDSLLLIP